MKQAALIGGLCLVILLSSWSLQAPRASADQDMSWEVETPIEAPAGNAEAARIAMNAAGNGIAVWRQLSLTNIYHVYAATYTVGTGWGPSTQVDVSSYTVSSLEVAIDLNGRGLAVWQRSDDENLAQSIYAARYTPTAGWGSVTSMEGSDVTAFSPQVAMNPNGVGFAAWAQFDIAANLYRVYASRFNPATGTWALPATQLDSLAGGPGIGGSGGQDLSVDPPGNGMVVWMSDVGAVNQLFANRYDQSTSTWGGEVNIGGPNIVYPNSQIISHDDAGNAMVVWTEWDGVGVYDIYARRFVPPAAWGAITLIEGIVGFSPFNGGAPKVSMDVGGNAMVVFSHWDVADGEYSVYANHVDTSPCCTWSGEVPIDGTAARAQNAQVASYGTDNFHAIWIQYDTAPTTTPISVISRRYQPLPTGWVGSAIPIETFTNGTSDPQLDIDLAGNVNALWRQSDASGRFNVYTNRFVPASGWGMNPRFVEPGAGHADRPQVDAGGVGRFAAAWHQFDGSVRSIFVNRWEPGVGWRYAPSFVESEAGDAINPDVTVDGGAGANVTVVWQQFFGASYDIYASRWTGISWVTTPTLDSLPGDASEVRVASNSAGVAFAVWRQFDSIGDYSIFASRYDPLTGTWGAAASLETSIDDAFIPDIAVDSAGNAIAVWRQIESGAGESIWANRYTGSSWGIASAIDILPGPLANTGQAFDPSIDMNSNGDAVVVWRQFDGFYFTVYSARYSPITNWGLAGAIESRTNDAFAPHVGMDAAGNAVAVWTHYDGSSRSVLANRYVTGTGWLTEAAIEPTFGDAGHVRIAVDWLGNAVAVWEQYDGGRFNVWSNRYVFGAGWMAPILLEGGGEDAVLPEVAVDIAGNGLAVWRQRFLTRNNIVANRFDEGTPAPPLALTSPTATLTNNPTVTVSGSTDAGATVTVDGTGVPVSGSGTFTTNVLLPDGPHTFVVISTTPAGGMATAWASITVDTVDPALSLTSPSAALTNNPLATVAGTTEVGATLTVNGATVAVDGTGAFSFLTTLVEGVNTFDAEAWDAAGNIATDSISTTLDTIAPALTLSSPVSGATNNATVTVSGTTELGATVTINGTSVPVSAGAFEWMDELDDGTYTFTVVANDSAGNWQSEVRSVTIDTTAPALAITSPANNAATASPSILVEGTTEPGAYIVVNGVVVSLSPSGGWSLQVGLADGANTVKATAWDAAGNSATKSITVTYNNPVPGLEDEIADTKNELNETMDDLADTNSGLNATKDGLAGTQSDLNKAKTQLADAQRNLNVALILGLLALILGAVGLLLGLMAGRKKGGEPMPRAYPIKPQGETKDAQYKKPKEEKKWKGPEEEE